MQQYQKDFVEFLLESNALSFGEFVTKSGRKSPFFINAGSFNTGASLEKLGEFYAHAIQENFGEADVLFGPAYKGIPLSVCAAMALSRLYGKNVRYCANRKEAKDHGEKGAFLGAKLQAGDKVVIVEDVTTAGTSVRETMELLKDTGAEVIGLVVLVDRMERGTTMKSALMQIHLDYGIKTCAIVGMHEIIKYLSETEVNGKIVITPELKKALGMYYMQYGAKNED